jgi:predicted GH43/DUF377 family glycosyl hydrolase
MKKIVAPLLCTLFFFACQDGTSPISQQDHTTIGNLILSFDKANAPAAVSTLSISLSRSGFDTFKKNVDVKTDTSATVLFEKIPIGTWLLVVDAQDISGTTLFTGRADVVVLENILSQVNLTLNPVPIGVGSIQINITWGSATTYRWIDFNNNPVLTKSKIPTFQTGVTLPKVIYDGTLYAMWFGTTYSKGGIGRTTSQDGISWTNVQTTNIIASDSGWDNGRVTTGALLRKNNQYYMYYNAFSKNNPVFQCGLAFSADGIEWQKYSQPVLTAPSWGYSVVTSDIIAVDSMYIMYFSGATSNGNRVGLAISYDGINWSHYGNGPVLSPTNVWEGNSVYAPSVKKEGNIYTMVYMGGKPGSGSGFGEAFSTDGIHWQKGSTQPIFTQLECAQMTPTNEISYPFQITVNDEKRIYYNGYDYGTGEWSIRLVFRK